MNAKEKKETKTLSERSKSLGISAIVVALLTAFLVGVTAGIGRTDTWWSIWYFWMVVTIIIQISCAVSSLIRCGRVGLIEEAILGRKILIKGTETQENKSEGGDNDGTEC